MAKIAALIVGLGIFGGWMSIVGNPHVVETIIGLALAFAGGFLAFKQLSK
jgi:hypothetical protein